MGYSSIAVLNLLYQHIAQSEVFVDLKKPNGKLCKFTRPDNSELEDIVLNDLGLERDDVQEGVFNVNQYVPNLKFPAKPEDKSQPDTGRILYLSTLINKALGEGEEVWNDAGEVCFKIQQDTVFEDANNQHYINFRVEFNLIN